MIVGAALGVAMFATVALAQWVHVQATANAKGYGKSVGLANAFLDTVDASADLAPGSYVAPDEGTGCPAGVNNCGDVVVRFTSTSPFAIHVSSITLGNPSGTCVGLSPYVPGGTFAVSVNVPANGSSSSELLTDAITMPSNAPESCANTVFEIPISGITGNKV